MKTIKQTYKDLYCSKDSLVKESNIIERIGFSTRGQIKNLLGKTRKGAEIESYITLCPFYDSNGGIKGDYDNFGEVGLRYQNKLKASLDVLKLLKNYFNLKLNFILADQMVLINSNYDINRFNNDIGGNLELYYQKISSILSKKDFSIQTFSDIGLKLDKICDVDEEKNEKDILGLLDTFGVDCDRFSFSMQIIIKAFGISGAFYLIKGYLEETKQLLDILEGNIFINTEVVGPLNGLYTIGDYKLDSKNMLVKVKI